MPSVMPKNVQTLGQLSVSLIALAGGANQVASHAIRKASLVAGQAVVSGTPVLSGRAKGNWVVGVDTRNTSTRGESFLEESQALMTLQTEVGKFNAAYNSTVNISNNLPYIVRLNEGHSMQADPGFVEEASRLGLNAVRFSNAWVDAGVL